MAVLKRRKGTMFA